MIRLALLPLLLTACGGAPEETHAHGDDDDAPITDTEDPGPSPTDGGVEVLITGAEGGDVQIGEAVLSIPPGALAEDTTITAVAAVPDASLPDGDTLTGLLYDFGPDGLAFSVPATLSLPLAEQPPMDTEVVVSWLDEAANAWVDLPSAVDGGAVVAEVEHFTLFVVRVVGASGPGTCDPFVACGGDPTGNWTFDSACIEGDPSDGQCPTATYGLVVSSSGFVDFDAAGTYQSELNITGTLEITVPPECLSGVGACSDIDDPSTGFACTGDPAVACDCTEPIDEQSADSGNWMVSGTGIMLQGADGDTTTGELCVDGNTLTVYIPADNQTYRFLK